MSDAVVSKVLYEDTRYYVVSCQSVSDGTGESAVVKVDVSGLTPAASNVAIEKIKYNVYGMAVKILFDATSDDQMIVLQGDGSFDFTDIGGIRNPKSTGVTGDVMFTTVGHTSGDSYSIILYCRKY